MSVRFRPRCHRHAYEFIDPTPTPTTPSPSSRARDINDQSPTLSISKSGEGHQSQGRKQLSHVQLGSRHLLTPELQDTRPAVLIPELSPSKRKEYEVYPLSASVDEDQICHGTKTQTDRQAQPANDVGMRSIREQEKSEAAVRKLKRLMGNIFEAEDQIQLDTSDPVPAKAAEYLIPADIADETAFVLTSGVQAELEIAISAVVLSGRFKEIPFDKVVRLQKLCEIAVRAAEAVDARLPDAPNDGEVEIWLVKSSTLDLGLRSARILLTIANGGREEKQIYSEDTLQSILQLLKTTCETVIVPAIELRSGGPGSDLFQALSSHKHAVMSLLSHTTKILQRLADLISSEGLTERAITTIEFLTTSLIFLENAHTEKDSLLGVQKGERLRIVAMDVLVQIFSRYKDHQAFIFDEVLMSLEKLPVTRQRARQYKLSGNKSIQLVSALILRLVQSSPMMCMDKSREGTYNKPLSMNDDSAPEDDTDSERLSKGKNPRRTDEVLSDARSAIRQLSDVTQPLLDSAQNSAQYVVQFLVSRAVKSTKTGDDPYRVLLDIFTEDFLTVLEAPEWPASALLLRFLLTSLMSLAAGEKSAAPAKNMALDVLGLMGAALSDIISRLRRMSRNLEAGNSGIDTQLLSLCEAYLSLELEETELFGLDGPYALVLDQLGPLSSSDGLLQTARKFHVLQWASRISSLSEDSVQEANKSLMQTANSLSEAITENTEPDVR